MMLLSDFLPDYKAEFMAKQVAKGLKRLGTGVAKGADDLASSMSIQPRGKVKKKKVYQGPRTKSPKVGESAAQAKAGEQGFGGTGSTMIPKGRGGGKYAGQSFKY